MMSGKKGTFSKQNGIYKRLLFYYEDFVYQASELWPMLSTNKVGGTCRRYHLLQGLYVPNVKTTTYVCNRFNTSFSTKDHKIY